MSDYILDLLKRMSDDSYREGEEVIEGRYENHKTISWAAYEEARNLVQEVFLPTLFFYAKNPVFERDKDKIHFIIGHIARNTLNLEATQFLLSQLKCERKSLRIQLILNRLSEIYKAKEFDLSFVKVLIEKKGSSIRISAYDALINCEEDMEEYFLLKLQSETREDDLKALLRCITYVGTINSLMYIEPHLKSRKREIKYGAQEAATTILLKSGHSFAEICNLLKVDYVFIKACDKNIQKHKVPF